MEFDENEKVLTIRGDKSKSGKPYEIKLHFDTGLYDVED